MIRPDVVMNQGFEETSLKSLVSTFILDNDGEVIGSSVSNGQTFTYPGKLENYEARVRYLDTRGKIMCEDFLRNVTITVTPRLNNAGILTTILSTNFTSSTSGNATMDFIDVDTKRTNPIQFAVWDPSIPSYTLSMKGFACNNSVYATVSNTIKVQHPQVTFLPDSSACPQAAYSLEDNMIDIMGPNPLYADKKGCSTAYNISSPYPAQYMFLQVYKDMKAFVSSLGGSSLYTLFHMSPILNCVQNATSTLCQNPFTTGTLSPNVNETIADFAGFGFFAAPYFSDSCDLDVSGGQIFRSNNYNYNTTIDDYLLVKGAQSEDLWVPVKKSVLTVNGLQGLCLTNDTVLPEDAHPCGMGLGIGTNRSHTHPWDVSSPSAMKFLDDSSWVDQPKAPVWNGTTNSTHLSLYLSSYVNVNGGVANEENLYWYVCPFPLENQWMMNVLGLKEFNSEGVCRTDNFVLGKDEKFGGGPLLATYYTYVGTDVALMIEFIPEALALVVLYKAVEFAVQAVKTAVADTSPKDFNGTPTLVYLTQFNPENSTIAYGANPNSNNSVYTAIWNPQASVDINLKDKDGGLLKKRITLIPRKTLLEVIPSPTPGPSLVYNSSSNEVTMKKSSDISRMVRYHVGLNNEGLNSFDDLDSIQFGIINIFKSGNVSASSSNGIYQVYNFSDVLSCRNCTPDDVIQGLYTVNYTNGKFSQTNIQVGADYYIPDVFSSPAYSTRCGDLEQSTIGSYHWSSFEILSTLMVKHVKKDGTESYWIPASTSFVSDDQKPMVSTYSRPDVPDFSLDCPLSYLEDGGCGLGINPFTHPWSKNGAFVTTWEPVETQLGKLVYNSNSHKEEEKNVFTKVTIHRNDTSNDDTVDTDSWTMCPNPFYETTDPASFYEFS